MKKYLIKQKEKSLKIVKIMKLTFLLLIMGILNASAISFSQDKKISIVLKDVTIKEIIDVLESNTNIKFFV